MTNAANNDIAFLKRDAIDDALWNQAVKRSLNTLVYAYTYWLDAMNPGWCALVYKNYDAIMPLPAKRKYGIKYLAQPAFTQQLGIFSNEQLDNNFLKAFYSKAQQHFRFAEIGVNFIPQDNDIEYKRFKNYELYLGKEYNDIYGNYTSDCKRNLKRAAKFSLQYKTSTDTDKSLDLFYNSYKNKFPLKKDDVDVFKGLITGLAERNKAFVKEVIDKDTLLASAVFVYESGRIYNLASSTLPAGRKKEATYFLFDELIKEFAVKPVAIDFEGSNIEGIEKFYQQFGAELKPYYFIKWNLLPRPLRFLKR